jgi:hypothetical protein
MQRLGGSLRPGMKGASGGDSYLKEKAIIEKNLNKELEGIKNRSMKGLIMAAAFIRNETEKTAPLTPVDYGNLRASWFVATAKGAVGTQGPATFKGPKGGEVAMQKASAIAEGQGTMAAMTTNNKKFLIMGYGANYAGFVHEFIPGMVTFKRPGAKEKWLQEHIYKNRNKIVQIVKDNAQIK